MGGWESNRALIWGTGNLTNPKSLGSIVRVDEDPTTNLELDGGSG